MGHSCASGIGGVACAAARGGRIPAHCDAGAKRSALKVAAQSLASSGLARCNQLARKQPCQWGFGKIDRDGSVAACAIWGDVGAGAFSKNLRHERLPFGGDSALAISGHL